MHLSLQITSLNPTLISPHVFKNIYKIVAITFLIATIATLFFLHNMSDTAALLCFETITRELDKIAYLEINWNSIRLIINKFFPYVSFRSTQLIIISVSTYPTDSLFNLVKIQGLAEWHVLAIGNLKTLYPTPRRLNAETVIKGAARKGMTTQVIFPPIRQQKFLYSPEIRTVFLGMYRDWLFETDGG